MNRLTFTRGIALAFTLLGASCTMQQSDAPSLAGPSEFGTSVSVSLSPDILQQDGASQSVVTVTTRGPNGAPLANVSLRAEIRVGGELADFGALSTRSLTTGGDGRATAIYTAPPSPPVSADAFTMVDIAVTPIGSDFNNSAMRFASLRLVPRGIIVVPANLTPVFTFTPTAPTANQTVLFDASQSTSTASNPIAGYMWDFGDGRTASGRTASNQYSTPGTYVVRLTITDGIGRSAQTSQSITVSAGANPVPQFTFSPTAPVMNQQINFNAVESTPAPGRRIVNYAWDFGDGAAGATGMQTSRAYARAGTYTVTLTVTDDVGRSASRSREVSVR